ncbi:regulatory protein RecX [Rhizorhabdus dicambivorans]|nr:regulatory protein RecX [Rhizorhabdus dicambivorans]
MTRTASRPARPFDSASLERAALDYAARYATTRAKLAAYLRRKLRERGWEGAGAPPVDALVARFAERGYVDDRAFAAARTDALLRRGYGRQRIGTALRAAGIDAETAGELGEHIDAEAEAAALRFARRKRIGPFAVGPADPALKRRWIAAMARAGHPMALVLKMLDAGIDEIEFET